MKYKLIVIDMDGTLLNDKHDVSLENKIAIKEAIDRGIKVAIATGRIFTSARFYANLIESNAPIIACNGAIIRNHQKDEVIYSNTMQKEDAIAVIKICKEMDIYFHFYDQENFYLEEIKYSSLKYQDWNEKQRKEEQVKIIKLQDAVEYLQQNDVGVLKICIIDDQIEKLEKVKEKIAQFNSVEINKSWYNNIEVMNKGVSKGKGIEGLSRILGIHKQEIIAFGDNYNDLSMKDYVHTFVAMGNGEDYVKQQADYITESNNESGVAKGIRKIVFNQEEFL